jgi:hypothetical protein
MKDRLKLVTKVTLLVQVYHGDWTIRYTKKVVRNWVHLVLRDNEELWDI